MSEQPKAAQWTRRDRWRHRREDFMDWLLSDRSVGGGSVPNSWARMRIEPDPKMYDGASRISVAFDNDAFGIMAWKGFPDNDPDDDMVCLNMSAPAFRRVAIWYLWRWMVGEWFGLRRWLFYKRLHRRVEAWRKLRPMP